VRVDLNTRRVDVLVSEQEFSRRRAAYRPPELKHQTPWQEIYRSLVGQLSTGACLEPATLYLDVIAQRGNPRHSH
jgi:dihydroxy-acid dehydratase